MTPPDPAPYTGPSTAESIANEQAFEAGYNGAGEPQPAGLPGLPDLLELAFQCMWKVYARDRLRFADDHGYIVYGNKWSGYAYSLLQHLTGRLDIGTYVDTIRRELGFPADSPPARPDAETPIVDDFYKQRDGESAWEHMQRQREMLASLERETAAQAAEIAGLRKANEEQRQHIYLASGYHMRTEREIEISQALEETAPEDRDTADNAIAELLALVDAGRNRVFVAESALTAARDLVKRIMEDLRLRASFRDDDRLDLSHGLVLEAAAFRDAALATPAKEEGGEG